MTYFDILYLIGLLDDDQEENPDAPEFSRQLANRLKMAATSIDGYDGEGE